MMNFIDFIFILIGILFITIPKHLPDKSLLPDEKSYIVKDPIMYRKLKEKQALILGVYIIVIKSLTLTDIVYEFIIDMLLLSMPLVVIFGMEVQLEKTYIKKLKD